MVERSRVRSSEWKQEASQVDEDMVWSAWKYAAVGRRIVVNGYY